MTRPQILMAPHIMHTECRYALCLLFSVLLLIALAVNGSPIRGRSHGKTSKNTHSYLSPAQSRLNSKLGRSNFTCKSIQLMLRKKSELTRYIASRTKDLKKSIALEAKTMKETTPATTKSSGKVHHSLSDLKLKVLRLYEREVNASEEAFIVVMQGLQRTLASDYQSLEKIRLSCEVRLKELQSIALVVEDHHNTLHQLEKEALAIQKDLNSSKDHQSHSMKEILSEISDAADKLESDLKEDLFSDMVGGNGQKTQVETVLKVGETSNRANSDKQHDYGGHVVIIDSHSNQYTLSRPGDITALVEDPHLVRDVVLLLVFAYLMGVLCCLINVPSLFGYGIAGMLVGPAGYNIIRSVVQVETIGDFGAVFIVFMAGLELSPEKLRKMWRPSVHGSAFLLLSCTLITIVVGVPMGLGVRQSIFVAACLSLCSAPLVHQLLEGSIPQKHSGTRSQDVERQLSPSSEYDHDVLGTLQGMLVSQDVLLGLLMALMPFFSDVSSSFFSLLLRFLQLVVGFILLLLFTRLLAQRVLEPVFKVLLSLKGRTESLLLGSLSICFLLLTGALIVGASLELGCFLAGIAISNQGSSIVDQAKKLLEPIREVFAAFFFASIGFHIFPTFLLSEFFTIFSVTLLIIVFKLVVGIMFFGYYYSNYCSKVTLLAASSLAQVSEFAFVLASRARRLRILSREVYLVIVSVTALSIILSPALWRRPCRMAAARLKRLSTRESSS